ncbi:doublecortin domain-containing protein 2-like [Myxocyprinus asiaticus]|uniref:doublecortin domain-containing protein 2-like n=1 Tax=Myxocyprinus asiaticus TaxID=70543 RepID=UPI002221391C|nr:doublecortin domain-containing protein 2-like [Myxocyprinus asiaticus]
MNAEKPHFLSQPEVKNIYFFRNGDPYFQPRRLVINAKRVSTFDTLLREVTGGVQASFGAVRNIYTPKGGHRVDSLEHLRSGEQYVAAGREKFKKIDYLQIGTRKKRTLQPNGLLKPVPQSRIIVSARFLKPIKEPCAIFVVANGDVLNPAVRFLIPNCVIGQFERILEMITEKMWLRIVGGVRSLYTFDGTLIMEGKKLENGQFYVAVGRDKFKRLPYSDLLFNKPIGMKRVNGSKAASLPPIYKYRRQNGDNHLSKSVVGGSGQDKTSAPAQSSKEQLSSFVREVSQARLMTIRKKRSGLTASRSTQENDDEEDMGGDDDKSSPEEGSGVEQEAEESSPDPEQEDNSQEHTTDIDGSSKTDTTEEPAHSEPADPDQSIEESPFNREEEKKPEDENTEDDENKDMEEEEKIEDDEEIKEEGETSELEANDTENKEMEEEENKEDDEEIKEEGETLELEGNDTNEEKQEEETKADGEETQNEETAEESEEQQVEGEEEINEENEGNQTEETPDQTEEVSANNE